MIKVNHGKRSITLIVILFACLFMLAGCQNVLEEQSEEAIAYEDLSQEFNNRSLYASVNVGDTIQVILYKG